MINLCLGHGTQYHLVYSQPHTLTQILITLRSSCGAVYCNRSCLFVGGCVWVCYHDNSKLHASILTKLGL